MQRHEHSMTELGAHIGGFRPGPFMHVEGAYGHGFGEGTQMQASVRTHIVNEFLPLRSVFLHVHGTGADE